LIHPTKKEWLLVKDPETKKKRKIRQTYYQMLRDKKVYIPAVIQFLRTNNDLPEDILSQLDNASSALNAALSNPNKACLSQELDTLAKTPTK
jgi:hypothetical protein